MRIAQLKKNSGNSKDTTYLHPDYQGSTRLQTDRVKTITATIDYDAWGQVRQQSGYPSAYTYTGQEWDDENSTNLFYLHARYYDPKLGRFTTPDPLPSDLNPYSYCNNNPAMMTDVSGMSGTMRYDPTAKAPDPLGAGYHEGSSETGRAGLFTNESGPGLRSGIIKGGVFISGYWTKPEYDVVVYVNGTEQGRAPLDGSEVGKAASALLAAYRKGDIPDIALGVGIVALVMGQVKFGDLKGDVLGNFESNVNQSYGDSGYKSQGTINISSSIVNHMGTLAGVLVKEIVEMAKFNGRVDVLGDVAGKVGLSYNAFDESNGGCSLCNPDNGAIGWKAMASIIESFGDYWSGGYSSSRVQDIKNDPGSYWERYDYKRIAHYCNGIGCGH
jgi:RHS repeat-associated protein